MKRLIIMLIAAAPSYAQMTLGGPVTGYIFDGPGRSIRSILGRPGAAYLGPVSVTDWDLASIAPNGKTALGLRGQSVNLIPNTANPESWTPLNQIIGTADRIAWSADSTEAVLLSSAGRQLQSITGLDATPVVHPAADLSALGSAISGWSVSPDARSIAFIAGAAGAS